MNGSGGVGPGEDNPGDLYLRMLRAAHGYGDADPEEAFEAYRAACRRARQSSDIPDHVHVPDPDTIKMPGPRPEVRAEAEDENQE